MVLAGVASTAHSSSWHFLWVGNSETRYFFDAESLEKNKNIVIIWIKTVQVNQGDKDGSWASALRWRIDCTKKTIQTLAASTYDQNGKFMKSTSGVSSEDVVIPDSTGDGVLKVACKPNFPKDTSGDEYFKLNGVDVFQATRNYAEMQKAQTDTAPK